MPFAANSLFFCFLGPVGEALPLLKTEHAERIIKPFGHNHEHRTTLPQSL